MEIFKEARRFVGRPIGSNVVPFWWLLYRILTYKPHKGTTLEPMGRVQCSVWAQKFGAESMLLSAKAYTLETSSPTHPKPDTPKPKP